MATHTVAVVPRVLARFALAVVAAAPAALASGRGGERAALTPAPAPRAAVEQPLVVPDVRGQAHVFAKVVLEEGGFAWKIRGKTRGYAANVVVRQVPEPGTRVHDTGQPLIVLELGAAGARTAQGRPENRSAYRGTRVQLYGVPSVPDRSPDRTEGQ